MAENDPDSGQPLDVEKIHYLVRLMKRYDLTDLNIRDGQVQIRLQATRAGTRDRSAAFPPAVAPRPDRSPIPRRPSRPQPAIPAGVCRRNRRRS